MLLDLKMPKVDGLAVLRTVKADPGLEVHPHHDARLLAREGIAPTLEELGMKL